MKASRAVQIFGQTVQQIRKDRQMTLEELALEIGIDTAHLSRIERGQKDITLSTASKVANSLGLELKLGKTLLSEKHTR